MSHSMSPDRCPFCNAVKTPFDVEGGYCCEDARPELAWREIDEKTYFALYRAAQEMLEVYTSVTDLKGAFGTPRVGIKWRLKGSNLPFIWIEKRKSGPRKGEWDQKHYIAINNIVEG